MRNVLEKSLKVNQNTHFIFYKDFVSENLAVLGIMMKNTAEPDR